MDADIPGESSPNDILQELKKTISLEFSADCRDISLMYANGTVQLEGAVRQYCDKIRAEILAFGVLGVKKVVNRLLIVPSGNLADISIARSVWQKIIAIRESENLQIDIEVSGGAVKLGGVVPSIDRYNQVYNAAKDALPGENFHIVNRLLIVSE